MKKLTSNQQSIINAIKSEFESLNNKTVSGCDDLLSYIAESIGQKAELKRQIDITNVTYEKANNIIANSIMDKFKILLSQYGYECGIPYVHRWSDGNIEYYKLRIIWNGHYGVYSDIVTTEDVYLYTKIGHQDGLELLKSVGLDVKFKYKDEVSYSLDEAMKHLADKIIKKQKSLIK